jgi:dihydromonapterin reductase / dihydrofolate reductase
MHSKDDTAPIVITGGAQRLGLAMAEALSEQGHAVVITYRRERPLLERLRQAGIDTIRADFDDEDGPRRLARELRRRYRSLRALIHNASQWQAESADVDASLVLQRMLRVHVGAPYLLNLECGELLQRYGEQHGFADIIHMSDYVAGTGSSKHIAYAASKAALDNLTLSFASKFAPTVKVNSVAPALLMFNAGDDEAYRQKAVKKSLLGIVPGEAEGVAAIQYLLQSSYLTGKTIALDGGRHLARAG